MEACSAALLYGHKRTQPLQDIEQGLNEHMSEFQNWEYAGDVGSINAGLLQIVGDCTAKILKTTPGFEESDELKVAKSRKLSQLLLQRRDAKQREYEVPEDINIAIFRLSRSLKNMKRRMIDGRNELRIEALPGAWRHRRFREAHKLSRLIAGACRGPRGRVYNQVSTTRATAAEWIE
eukprot:1891713-Pyramimonas_sp.AAC.1